VVLDGLAKRKDKLGFLLEQKVAGRTRVAETDNTLTRHSITMIPLTCTCRREQGKAREEEERRKIMGQS
jgi:hypothetical protein